jgi:hypothetical protein
MFAHRMRCTADGFLGVPLPFFIDQFKKLYLKGEGVLSEPEGYIDIPIFHTRKLFN